MMNIEGHWEVANDLQDVSRIIREYYNPELANKIDELIEEITIESIKSYVEELENIIEEIRRIVG